MTITKFAEEEQREPTGVGADLFIRKNKPGPTVGVGYTVDVFENGVKTEAIKAKDKDRVKEIIQEYKVKYNTTRAFNNENLLHITYKTKEERGEMPTEQLTKPLQETEDEANKKDSGTPFEELGEATEKEKLPETERKKEKPKMTERGETAMESLDTALHVKIGKIRNLLNKLVEPTLPIMKRALSDVEEGTVDFLPQTPLPGESDDTTESLDESSIAKQLATKLVEFIEQNANTPEEEDDELYNEIKEWMKTVKINLKNWERTSGNTISRKQLSKNIKAIVTSGNIEKIQQELGKTIDQDTADLLQRITLMNIGSPPQPKGVGEEKSLSESLGKAASTTADLLEKVVGITQTSDESNMFETAKETVKDLVGDGLDALQEVFEKVPDNISGTAVVKAIEEIERELEEGDMNNEDVELIEYKASDFWNFARQIKTATVLDRAFELWANRNKLSFNQASHLWKKIQEDVDIMLFKKTAAVASSPVATIQVSHMDENGQPTGVLYKGEFKVDENNRQRSPETGKVIITDHIVGSSDISKEFDTVFISEPKLVVPAEYNNKEERFRLFLGASIIAVISDNILNKEKFGRFKSLDLEAEKILQINRGGYVLFSFYKGTEPARQMWFDGKEVTETSPFEDTTFSGTEGDDPDGTPEGDSGAPEDPTTDWL